MPQLIFKNLQAIKEKVVSQGVAAYPIFLMSAALCGFKYGKRYKRFQYTEFFFVGSRGYINMWYLKPDLVRLWKLIKFSLGEDKNFLNKIKKVYQRDFNKAWLNFVSKNRSLLKYSNEELLELLKLACRLQTISGGLAHILEPIGIMAEEEFKDLIGKRYLNSKIHQEEALNLARPKGASFLLNEELELAKILGLPKTRRELALQKHVKKYYWFNSGYTGSGHANITMFSSHMKDMSFRKAVKLSVNKKSKLKFNQATKNLAKTIAFSANWQDERKLNIMKVNHHFGILCEEAAKRLKIPYKYFCQIMPSELLALKDFSDTKDLAGELRNRYNGAVFFQDANKERAATNKRIVNLASSESRVKRQSEVFGNVAYHGQVKGVARVCFGLKDITKVKESDILIISMTRPEYVLAMRKAAAFVTDEGGITSHAAIVAREMKKPCVIGTKIATKVFKDGDLVEVDANKGIVRKI